MTRSLNCKSGAAKGHATAAGALATNRLLRSAKYGSFADAEPLSGQELIRREFDGPFMQIIVRDNNVDQALRALKKKLQREGVYREMKLRRHYEKPSEKRARERAAAIRRARKLERKRAEREGNR